MHVTYNSHGISLSVARIPYRIHLNCIRRFLVLSPGSSAPSLLLDSPFVSSNSKGSSGLSYTTSSKSNTNSVIMHKYVTIDKTGSCDQFIKAGMAERSRLCTYESWSCSETLMSYQCSCPSCQSSSDKNDESETGSSDHERWVQVPSLYY